MEAWLRPEMIDRLLIYPVNAVGWATWSFDVLVAFVISFGVLYGLFVLIEKLLPRRLGGRPRTWCLPCLFAGTFIGFPLFLDQFVSRVASTGLGRLPWWPGMWFIQTLSCVWLIGCVLVVLRTLKSVLGLAKVARSLPVFPDNPIVTRAFAATGIKGTVQVKAGPPDTPIVSFGLLRKMILLPEDFALRYSASDQYAILLHECIHCKNHDQVKLFCLTFLKAIVWFDPILRHALARVKTGMELLSDWTVVNTHHVDRTAYAALVVTALSEPQETIPGFSDSYRLASQRLSHILKDSGLDVPGRMSRRRAIVLLAGLGIVLFLAAVVYQGLEPVPPSDTEVFTRHGYTVSNHAERTGVFSRYTYFIITR